MKDLDGVNLKIVLDPPFIILDIKSSIYLDYLSSIVSTFTYNNKICNIYNTGFLNNMYILIYMKLTSFKVFTNNKFLYCAFVIRKLTKLQKKPRKY